MMIKKWNMFDTNGGVFFEKFFNFKAASVTIYPDGLFFLNFRFGERLGRVLASSRLAMKKGCIFLFFGWLAAGFRVIAVFSRAAGGGRQDRQPPGGRLLE